MQKIGKLLFTAGVTLLAVTATAMAQERFGELSGVVMDASQAVLPNANVTITNKESGRVVKTTTGSNGSWFAPQLEPGKYKIRIEAQGFQAQEYADVSLLVGKKFKIDTTLQVGATSESVQVTEQAPLIDFTGNQIAQNITADEFNRIPKARSFQQLAMASPSVNSGDIEGGIQVNGSSGAENQFNIDGVSVTSLVNGKFRQGAIFEILQEVQVKTAGIDAEYGGALGGVISAITKSGGNSFHGDIHYYFTGNQIAAGPTKRLDLSTVNERDVQYVQDGKYKNNQNEVGGSLGGRLIKDKLFFFVAFSPRFVNRSNDYLFGNGTQPGTFTNEQTYHTMFQKITYVPTQKVRLNVSYLWTPSHSKGSLPGYFGDVGNASTQTLASAEPNRAIGWSAPQNNYTGQLDLTLTNTSLLSIRAGRFWDNYKTTGIPSVSTVEYATSGVGLPFDIPANLRQPIGFSSSPRRQSAAYDLVTRTYVQADFSTYRKFLGQHNIKAGVGTSKGVNRVDYTYPGNGYVQVYWNTVFTSPTLGRQTGQYGYYTVTDFGTRGTTGANLNNFYFQDQWRILPRLTLTLGIRLENEKIPSFRRDLKDYAFSFGYGDKIGPRVGAAYDLLGNGKVKLYGSYGRYFDWVKYELSRGTFGGDFYHVFYRSLDTSDVLSLSGTNLPGRNIWSATVPFRDRRVPSFDLIAPGIKPMGTQTYNVGAEWQLGPQTVFRAGYNHSGLLRTIEDLGALDASGNEVYLYGNPGEGAAKTMPTSGATKPFPMPTAKRSYDAMELSVTRRFAKSYFLSASYVLSRLYGNYAGLASSDEITSPSTGLGQSSYQQSGTAVARQGTSSGRGWDLDEVLFDSKGHLDVVGRLATDRPHVFKLYGSKQFKWGTEVGANFYGGSGTPISTFVNTINQTQAFVNGRGDMGRTPILTQTDLLVSHEFKMKWKEGHKLRVEMNMQNLFNQKTARNIFNNLNRGAGAARPSSSIDLSKTDLFKGYDFRAMIAGTPDAQPGKVGALDPRYGMADLFNTGFAGRFGIKYIF